MCDESCDFVSKKCAIESFIAEHEAEPMYRSKLQELTPRYSAIRRTRADGSCFYRGLAFAYLESMLGKRAEISRLRERLMESRNELLAAGFQETSFGDGYGAFLRVVDSAQIDDSGSALLRSFNHLDVSDGAVRYLRLVTSAFLRNRADFYQPFVAEGLSIADFCAQHVEPMSAVCDHIHVSALTEALAIPLQVEYADSAHSAVTPLVFPAGSEPSVYMLYKQDHYTVLYRGAEP